MKSKLKRFLSGTLSIATAISAVPMTIAHAEEQSEPYPYTLFAASQEEGAITVNAGNFCVNGNIATNGTIVSSGNMNHSTLGILVPMYIDLIMMRYAMLKSLIFTFSMNRGTDNGHVINKEIGRSNCARIRFDSIVIPKPFICVD